MSKIEEIQKIKNLLDEGLISLEEFDRLKIGIIDNKSENKSFQSNIDEIRKEIDEKKEILKERLEEKKCPNCNNIIYSKDLSCNSCGVSNERQKPKEEKTDISKEFIEENKSAIETFFIKNHITSKDKTYGIIIIVVLIGFLLFNFIPFNNHSNETEAPSEEALQTPIVDTISNVISVDTPSVSVEENENFQTVEGYSFGNYRTKKSETVEKSIIDYASNPLAKVYKTLITNAYNSGEIDFAGYYITVLTSQSMGEMSGVIVDTRDGKVYDLPIFNISYQAVCDETTTEFESKYNAERLIHYSNSNLLVARGCDNNSLTYEFFSYDEDKKEFVIIKNLETPLSKPCEE